MNNRRDIKPDSTHKSFRSTTPHLDRSSPHTGPTPMRVGKWQTETKLCAMMRRDAGYNKYRAIKWASPAKRTIRERDDPRGSNAPSNHGKFSRSSLIAQVLFWG